MNLSVLQQNSKESRTISKGRLMKSSVKDKGFEGVSSGGAAETEGSGISALKSYGDSSSVYTGALCMVAYGTKLSVNLRK